MTSSTLTLSEAILLGHVLAAKTAASAGIPLLAIKGPALTMQGLRADRVSTDVDVLVAPNSRDQLILRFEREGWSTREHSGLTRVLPPHAVALRHDAWPIEIDVHDRFPGLLADMSSTFEALWRRRSAVQLAGVEVLTCDPVGNAVITALHLLRDPGNSAQEIQDLALRYRQSVDADGMGDLRRLAEETGCEATLQPFAELVGVQLAPAINRPSPWMTIEDWRLRTSLSTTSSWGAFLARLPMRYWPAALWKGLSAPRPQEPNSACNQAVQVYRWRRVLSALPEVLREYRIAKRAATPERGQSD